MKRFCLLLLLALLLDSTASTAWAGPGEDDTACYELRIYETAPGKLDVLQERFRRHTTSLFARHGMTNIGYWVPVANPEGKLIYIVSYPDCEARGPAWEAFGADPAWRAVAEASRVAGPVVTGVTSIVMQPTDFSVVPGPAFTESSYTYELRTYTAAPGKLAALQARFRDHTTALFERHGMVNVGYWVPTEAEQGAANTLIYVVAHESHAAAQRSWAAFIADPDWQAAYQASRADGPLVDHIESVFMTPTDYSPIY